MAFSRESQPFLARVLSALLVAALLAPDLARADASGTATSTSTATATSGPAAAAAAPAIALLPSSSSTATSTATKVDPAAKAEAAPDVTETHTNGDLERYQAAIDTDKIGKDYSNYFEALIAIRCPAVIAEKKKGLLVYFKNKSTGKTFPIVVHCNEDSTGEFASTQEILKPIDPDAAPACIGSVQDLKDFQTAVKLASTAGQAALAASTKCASGNNDVELDASSCMSSLADSFRDSWGGIKRAVTGESDTPPNTPMLTKQTCTETLAKVFIKNFVATGQFVVDLGKGIGAMGKEAWNGTKWVGKEAVAGGKWIKDRVADAIYGQDNDTSEAALNASSQSNSLLAKLKSTNPTDIWQAMVSWGGKVLAGFKSIFTDELGCQVWSGVPMDSTCLSPMSLHCVTCGQIANMICGTIGFIGSEAIMSLMTGIALGAAGRMAALVKDTIKAKMFTDTTKLAALQTMLYTLQSAPPVVTTETNARRAVDLADKLTSGSMTGRLSDQLASLNVSQAMDDLMSRYPGMVKVRKIHYHALGTGRETADYWISRLMDDTSFLETAGKAAQFAELEKTYEKFAKRVAELVRSSRTGKLSEEQIQGLEKQFSEQYLAKVTDALGKGNTYATVLPNGTVQLIDRSLVAEDGTFPAEKAFTYKPGINLEALENLSAKDTADKIAHQLQDSDGFINLKGQVGAGEALPGDFPSSLHDGFTYAAKRDLPSNFLDRFSLWEAGRQYGRMDVQRKLDSSLGVNRNSSFLVITSEDF